MGRSRAPPSALAAMSMHTPAEWAHSAASNMWQAQQSQNTARHQNMRSKSAYAGTVRNNVQQYLDLAQAMRHKVDSSHKLTEMLQQRADSITRSVEQTNTSLSVLEKGLLATEAPLQLCQWRAEQREKRPLREQVRDAVEIALEEEKAVHTENQRKFQEAIRRTKVMIGDLSQCLRECQKDIEEKMQALCVDEMCLRSTETSMHRVLERTPPPTGPRPASGPRSPNSVKQTRLQAQLQESSRNEATRLRQAKQHSQGFAAKEQLAKALREENARLERSCGAHAEAARAKTERRLQERVSESQLVRRSLATELRETQQKINETKQTISETRHHIKALDEPVDNTAACSSFRTQRASREGILDPVSTALLGHRSAIQDCHKELVANHEQEKSNLQDLQQRRDQLKDDLRDKTAGLHIDLNCITHEVVRLNGQTWTGLNKSKASWMNKVDRTWVPGVVAFRASYDAR